MTDFSERLADHIARGVAEGIDGAHANSKERRFAERTEWFELMEVELADAVRRLGIIDPNDPEHSEMIRQFLKPIAGPENLTDFLFLIVSMIGLVLSGTQAAAAGAADQMMQRGMITDGFVKPAAEITANWLARHYINESDANDWLGRVGYRDTVRSAAKRAGYNHLSPTEAVALWRLKRIEEGTVDSLMEDNALNADEAAYMKSLRWQPPDMGTVVAAVTQSQIDQDQFRYLMEQNGVDPDWAHVIFETAGQSPPPDMIGRLFREGWMTEGDYRQALLESPIKNKYVDVMTKLRFRFPPMRTTLKMLTDHVIEAPEAQQYLEKIGFFPEDARRLIESAQKHGSTSVKNLSPSVIEKLYEVGKWDRGQAEGALQALGYDATESDLLLTLVDEHKSHMQTDRAATSIGTRYVSWKIDRGLAVTLLDQINVPTAQRDEMFDVWDARRDAQTLHLSEAFLHKAFKLNNITAGEVEKRLLAMGYDATDTAIIMATDFAEVAPKAKTKDLTRADETKRYKAGIIDKAAFKARLEAAGYDATEADQIIELVDGDIKKAADKEAATNGA